MSITEAPQLKYISFAYIPQKRRICKSHRCLYAQKRGLTDVYMHKRDVYVNLSDVNMHKRDMRIHKKSVYTKKSNWSTSVLYMYISFAYTPLFLCI